MTQKGRTVSYHLALETQALRLVCNIEYCIPHPAWETHFDLFSDFQQGHYFQQLRLRGMLAREVEAAHLLKLFQVLLLHQVS